MNLSELSNLVKVIDHLKNVINTSGINRFSNTTLSILKKRLSEFDEMFISEMLNYEDNKLHTAKLIHNAVLEAREQMGMGLGTRTPPSIPVVKDNERKKNTSKKNKLTKTNSSNEENVEKTHIKSSDEIKKETSPSAAINQPYMQDESFALMLEIEKQKIASKKT